MFFYFLFILSISTPAECPRNSAHRFGPSPMNEYQSQRQSAEWRFDGIGIALAISLSCWCCM